MPRKLDSTEKTKFENEGLPEGWMRTSVGSIYKILGGGTPSTKIEEYWKGTIPWITSADIHGLYDIRPRKQITNDAIQNSTTNFVPKNSIIVVTRVSLGKIALVQTPLCFSQDSQALLSDCAVVNPHYALYFLSQAVQVFKYRNQGTTILGVTKKQLVELPIFIPPLLEQHRIVSKIESIFAQIDAAKERLERLARQTSSGPGSISQLKSSVLKQAFEGKLVPQDPNDEPAEVLLRKLHKDSERELVFDTEGFPEGWVGTKIKAVCTTKSGGTPSRGVQEHFGGNIPWIKSGELNDSIIAKCEESITEFGLKNSNAIIYPKNTVLMAMYGATVGRVSILNFEASTNQAVCAFLHSDEILITKYLFWFLKSIRSNLLSVRFGGAQKNLSQEIIKQIRIKVPPINEQHRIVQKIESIFAKIDAHIMHVVFA